MESVAMMNFGSLAFRPKAGPLADERKKVGARKDDGAVGTDAVKANQDFFAAKAPEGLPLPRKWQLASNGYNKLQKIAQDPDNIQEITQTQNDSNDSSKRRLSESEDTSKCFDLEVQFMDRPCGSHLAPSLIIRISGDFSLYGVISTLLVLHCDHFAASRIDPENVWLVELFLPAKDSDAVPEERALVEEIDMEDSTEDITKIWERFLTECTINSKEMTRDQNLVGLQKGKRTKMRLEDDSTEMDAKPVGNTMATAPKPAGPMIRHHLNA